jgi:hypothetical protein
MTETIWQRLLPTLHGIGAASAVCVLLALLVARLPFGALAPLRRPGLGWPAWGDWRRSGPASRRQSRSCSTA